MKIFEPEKQILYEDNHIIIVDKYPSQIVQGDKTGDEPLNESLKAYLKKKYHKPGEVFLGVVHRLDRPTGGLLIFARTSKALTRLNRMLQEHQIDKTYHAMVKKGPLPGKGRLIHYLCKNKRLNKSFVCHKNHRDAKKAVLDYAIIGESDTFYLLEIKLQTGRHHQIRVQLSSLGFPIKGDLKYGYPRSNKDGGIALHASRLSFLHPVRKTPVTVESMAEWENLFRGE